VLALAGATTATGVAASGATTHHSSTVTIGWDVPLISNPYWALLQNFAEGAAKQFGIKLITAQANTDDATQISQIQGFIADKVNGMVVGPVDNTVGKTILSLAQKANIPLTFMQRLPGVNPSSYSSKIFVGYVGTDDQPGGALAAKLLYASGARKWVGMTGALGNSVAVERLQGAQAFVKAHSAVSLLKVQYGNEARSAGVTTMQDFLSEYPGPSFNGVWSFNDEGALGAIDALKKAGDLGKVKVVAIDGTVDGINAVANGQLVADVGGGDACGAFALVELYDFLHGHMPNKRVVNIPLIAVTKNNVAAYESQVIKGAAHYDFKSVSATFTPGANTSDYVVKLH